MKIIAEVGSNLLTLDDGLKSIVLAKDAGADIVKFQWYSSEDLYGFPGHIPELFPQRWLINFADKAADVGIGFACTVFSPVMINWVAPMVDVIKIASSDMLYRPLIDAALRTGKEVIISTGGHTETEIELLKDYLADHKDRVRLMYCNAEYPTYKLDPRWLEDTVFDGFRRGLSDHSKEIYMPAIMARERGIDYIEKHVNLAGVTGTPDAGHSLGYSDFSEYCKAAKGEPLGDLLVDGESGMRKRHNRRLIALRSIRQGEKLELGQNYDLKRSLVDSIGGDPWEYDKLTEANRNYSSGETIDQ